MDKKNLKLGRRDALRMIGLGSAAVFSQSLGTVSAVEPSGSARRTIVPSGKSLVSFTSGSDRRVMMAEVLKPFEKQIREGLRGKQLVLKPNMVVTNRPLAATHADALRGVLEFIKPFYKGQIIIAEGSGANGESSPGFKNYGYLDLQQEFNLKFIDTNTGSGSAEWIIDKDLHLKKILITDVFLDPKNYIISISRLKTHNTVVMTAGVKNMVMAAPLNIPAMNGNQQVNHKREMHAGGSRWLHYNMFLVAQRVQPDLTVIDGLEGMEGNGPTGGTAVDHRIALAGTDVFAVDSVCAKLMNIPMENLGYLNYCADYGLGNIYPDKIEIIGNKNSDKYIIPYKMPESIDRQLEWKAPLNI
jgi:uncharacterized protein (DUF362 family)